ncbi:MAG: tyrosine-type recombinase/integrase [Flavobacteriales bacterium]|nr:tyrosine-type recombinase/integrase [Flavobacteriales bacterium]
MELNRANTKLLNAFGVFINIRNYKGKKLLHITPVKEFLEWTQQRGIRHIERVESKHILEYYQFLSTRPNHRRGGMLSDSTINNHLFSIKLLNEYLLEQQIISRPLIIPRKNDQTRIERKILTIDEIKILYKSTKTEAERALLAIAYGCGLRRSEIQHLNLSDVKLTQGLLIVKSGKGGKRREVPMSDGVIRDVKAFVIGERTENILTAKSREEALFINRSGRRMSGEYIHRMLQQIIKRSENEAIQNKQITLHCLRHSIATHLADKGATMDFIREFLGHAELDTSQIYAKKRKRNQVFKV